MKGRVLLVIGLALLLLGTAIGLYALSGRTQDFFGNQSEADLGPMWITLGACVVFLVAFGIVNHDPRRTRTAHPRMGEKATMDKGDVDRTYERAGEVRRVGGKWF